MGLFSIFKKSSTLYYPGCVTFFKFPESFKLYNKIFSRLGIEFRLIDEKICCGLSAFEAGYETEARKLVKSNFELFKQEQITSIITNSPCCYKMFSVDYGKIVPDWDIETKNVWRMILAKLEEKPGLIKYNGNGVIAYQDSCYLGRYCEIYDEPRKILELIGYDVTEISDSFEESVCCGSCGGLARTNPDLAGKIAKQRIMQAKRLGIKRIVVCSFEEYELLKNNSEGSGVEILEMSDVLGLALGLKKIEEKQDPAVDEIIEESKADDEEEEDESSELSSSENSKTDDEFEDEEEEEK